MLLGRGARDIPYLLEPSVEVILANSARLSLCVRWLSVSSRLSLHKYEFYIILYDGVWLIGLAEELGAIFDFIRGIGDLVPNDRVQVVKSDAPAHDADVGVQWEDQVTSEIAPSDAHISDDAHQTAAGDKDSVHVSPDFLQLKEEFIVVLDVAELVWVLVVPLEIPVGGRSYDQVNRSVADEARVSRISVDKSVNGCLHVVTQAPQDGIQGPWQSVQEKGRSLVSKNLHGSHCQPWRQ